MEYSEEEHEVEMKKLDVEDWQNDNSEDSFDVWKMKKYVNEKIAIIIGVVIGVIVVSRFI